LVCALFLGITLFPHIPIWLGGIFILAGLLLYAYSPRAYVVADRCIVVRRLAGNARFPLEGLREARAAGADDAGGAIQLFANGSGAFGYYGLFRTSKLGKCTWYVTDRSKALVVTTQAGTALFSPADASGFLAAVGAPVSMLAVQPVAAGGSKASKVVGAASALIGVAGFTFAVFALLYSPGPPSYTLTPDALTFHDKFYPVTLKADAVEASQIRVVDFTQEPDWRPVQKANGFNNSHYEAGKWRLASGKVIEMYRAGGNRLVLIPGKGAATTVLYQAQDPAQFAAQVRREWLAR
jgi:hypothetical protein